MSELPTTKELARLLEIVSHETIYDAGCPRRNAAERKVNFQTLLRVYKLASSAVHETDVETNDKNTTILKDAQSFARKVL